MLQQPSPVLSVVFFILLIFFGSFFVFNLVLVVVAENYLKVRAQVRLQRLHTLIPHSARPLAIHSSRRSQAA